MHGPPTDQQSIMDFQQGMVSLQTDIQNELLAEYGLNEQRFTELIQKHANAPEVQTSFMQMQMGIQQKIQGVMGM